MCRDRLLGESRESDMAPRPRRVLAADRKNPEEYRVLDDDSQRLIEICKRSQNGNRLPLGIRSERWLDNASVGQTGAVAMSGAVAWLRIRGVVIPGGVRIGSVLARQPPQNGHRPTTTADCWLLRVASLAQPTNHLFHEPNDLPVTQTIRRPHMQQLIITT